MVVAGGYDGSTQTFSSVEQYDPSTGTWTVRAPLLIAREGAAMVSLGGGDALVIGGVWRSPPPNQNVSNIIGQLPLRGDGEPGLRRHQLRRSRRSR